MYLMTCDGREDALSETLCSLAESDWPEMAVVVRDVHRLPDRKASQTATALRIFEMAQGPECDYVAFCEDDILFNKSIYENLCNWKPLQDGALVASAYHDKAVEKAPGNTILVPYDRVAGSQFLLVKKSWLPELLAWWPCVGDDLMQDLRVYRALGMQHSHVYLHAPTLVQHQSRPSTWGGGAHRSPVWNPFWRHDEKILVHSEKK
jgi:hypothetical protein